MTPEEIKQSAQENIIDKTEEESITRQTVGGLFQGLADLNQESGGNGLYTKPDGTVNLGANPDTGAPISNNGLLKNITHLVAGDIQLSEYAILSIGEDIINAQTISLSNGRQSSLGMIKSTGNMSLQSIDVTLSKGSDFIMSPISVKYGISQSNKNTSIQIDETGILIKDSINNSWAKYDFDYSSSDLITDRSVPDLGHIKGLIYDAGISIVDYRFFISTGPPPSVDYIVLEPGSGLIYQSSNLIKTYIVGIIYVDLVPTDPIDASVFIDINTGTLHLEGLGTLGEGQKIVMTIIKKN